jgi:hypothetical protein
LTTENDAAARQWFVDQGFTPEASAKELIVIHSDPASVLPEILRNLPIKVRRVAVNEPSLEDVFLKLTGKGL